MPKVLNQNEVDALLDMVQAAEVAVPVQSGQPAPGPQTARDAAPRAVGYNVAAADSVYIFDFKRPERVSTEQSGAIEVLHENFARNLSASLSGYLRTVIDVRLISVEQFTYSEFTMSVPSPTIFNSLSCKPLSGSMILEMNPSIIFPFIDRLLGGGSAKQSLLERPFTQIELGLINTILARLLDQLEEAWQTVLQIEFRIVESETNPMLMQIVAPNEPVILLSFEVIMGKASGLFNLCIPYKVIEPIIGEFSHTNWFSVQEVDAPTCERRCLLENASRAPLEIHATLAEISIQLKDLLTLRPGDIIDLGKPKDGEVVLSIGREAVFAARPGTHRGRYALVIGDPIDPRTAVL